MWAVSATQSKSMRVALGWGRWAAEKTGRVKADLGLPSGNREVRGASEV